MSRPMCTVCKEREKRSSYGMLCAQCIRSYGEARRSSGDIAIIIEWAANRARRFEHRRLRAAVAKLEAVEKEVRRG